jgi:hypothetical protein
MKRLSNFTAGLFRPLLLAALAVPLLAILGCDDVSPALGKYYTGRTLHLSVVAMEREPELIYTLPRSGDAPTYYRISPTEADQELLMLRVKVENHKATSAIVDIDQGAAEVRDFFHEKYFPIDVKERPEEIDAPENISEQRVARCPFQHPADLCFLWNATYADGETRAFELQQGFGVDGWLIFEVPKDAEIRELRWRAGDGLTIEF